MVRRSSKKRIVLAVSLVLLIVIILLNIVAQIKGEAAYKYAVEMDEGWTLTVNDETWKNVTLSTTNFGYVGKGDIVTAEVTMPTQTFRDPTLRVLVYHCTLDVYLDGELIYTHGAEQYEKGDVIGSGYHWIGMPAGYEGKTLLLVMKPNSEKAYTNLKPMYLDEATRSIRDFISDTLYFLCGSIFLIAFGLCLILIALFMQCISKGFAPLIYAGLFAFLIGIWAMCNKGDIQLFVDSRIVRQYLEFFSLYSGAIPVLAYIRSLRQDQEKKDKVSTVLILCNVVMIAVTVILHMTKVVVFSEMLRLYHFFFIIVIIYIVGTSIYHVHRGRIQEKLILVGVFGMTACFAADILIFNLSEYINAAWQSFQGISVAGAILFTLCMLGSYAINIYEGLCSRFEKEMLLGLAYTDELTKLANRAKYEELIQKYDEEETIYTIIEFDVNNLKETNDSLGHNKGDQLLNAFANLIREVFYDAALVARIGGDEFIVIMKGSSKMQAENALKEYERLEKLANEKAATRGFEIVAAWGVATNTETEHRNAKETVMLADQRMYERKKQMKDEE